MPEVLLDTVFVSIVIVPFQFEYEFVFNALLFVVVIRKKKVSYSLSCYLCPRRHPELNNRNNCNIDLYIITQM